MTKLCRALADTMQPSLTRQASRFSYCATRVLAYPAAHYTVSDGEHDYGFIHLNLRMGSGRLNAINNKSGSAPIDCARALFDFLFSNNLVGLTLPIDEGAQGAWHHR